MNSLFKDSAFIYGTLQGEVYAYFLNRDKTSLIANLREPVKAIIPICLPVLKKLPTKNESSFVNGLIFVGFVNSCLTCRAKGKVLVLAKQNADADMSNVILMQKEYLLHALVSQAILVNVCYFSFTCRMR